jgi:hypothetical protein
MFDVIKETFMKENLAGDKQFIDELVGGLDKDELKILKKLAQELMLEQGLKEKQYKKQYENAYKYIACRRLYKKEIETFTNKTILGDYISKITERWVVLPRR